MFAQINSHMSDPIKYAYSKTSLEKPPLLQSESGHNRQVALNRSGIAIVINYHKTFTPKWP